MQSKSIAVACALASLAGSMSAQQSHGDFSKTETELRIKRRIAPTPRADRGKTLVETPLKVRISPAPRADRGKTLVEGPIKRSVAKAGDKTARKAMHNPKVQPGAVRWHANYAAARAAAKRSGKAVLLFQLLGKLDDAFC